MQTGSDKTAINIGSIVDYNGINSSVVGVDQYKIRNIYGHDLYWNSYTLVSANRFPYDRWWLVFLPELTPYCFVHSDNRLDELAFEPRLTGLVNLLSSGDADLSDDIGSLHMFKRDDDALFCVEVFPDSAPLTMMGRPANYIIRE